MYLEPKSRVAQVGPSDVGQAVNVLRQWAAGARPEDLAALSRAIAEGMPTVRQNAYPEFSRAYPQDFTPDDAYISAMPDLQNGPASMIRGAREPVRQVGIADFRLPLRYRSESEGHRVLETSVTGTVDLGASRKGINMSRIMRSFYRHSGETFDFDTLARVIGDYRTDLECRDARILLRLSYPALMRSLRSGLSGWQYYDFGLEVVTAGQDLRRFLHLDYVYASTCPCSLELSEHARRTRAQLATPHSQRSVARISAEFKGDGAGPWFDELIALCRLAVPTETQVLVKREDEQAFAELNAANPIFVEDAARLFWERLREAPEIGDFRVVASHQESLHSHDAVSVMTDGSIFASLCTEPQLFASMRNRG